MKNIILVDGNALMHRSYHGMNRSFTPMHEDMPVGMVYGFVSTVLNVIEAFDPAKIITTFDTPEPTFRHEADPNYKAHRSAAPDDFYPQAPFIREFLDTIGIPSLEKPGYESDDIIGTLCKKFAQENEAHQIKILSGDLDFLQLVDAQVRLLKFNGRIDNSIEYGPDETFARYGITPAQMIDFKAICGDSSDNYKGIEGIGPKGAEKLLTEFQTLDGVLNNLDKLTPKIREKFESQIDYVRHCQHLAEIMTTVPIQADFGDFDLQRDPTDAFLAKMGFRALQTRFERLDPGATPVAKKPVEKPRSPQMSLF